MRKKILALSVMAAAILTACNNENLISEVPQPAQSSSSESHYLKGVVNVKVSDAVLFETKASASPDLGYLGIVSIERLFPDAGEWEDRHREAGLDRWYRVEFSNDVPRTKAESGFANIPGVIAVDTPRKKAPQKFDYFNDPYLYYQWGYYNDGTLKRNHRSGADINVIPVWENYTAGSKDVLVAVIDTGVDLDHEDLAGVVIPGGKNGSKNFCDGQVGYNIIPGDHGTHVAGTIAAINNNGKGGGGVAGGNDGTGGVRILSCQIFSTDDAGGRVNGDSAAALVWAADHGATIANNSWGYEFDYEADAKNYANYFLHNDNPDKDAIDYFVKYAGLDKNGNQVGPMKGGVCIFAAGNGDKNGNGIAYGTPAIYDKVIAVAAHGPDNRISSYSNYGPWVDIIAPGGMDSGSAQDMVLSCGPDNEYYFMAGTSMATPHVTGVAALLLSYFGGPGFTNEQLTEKLVWGAKYGVISSGEKQVGGRLDALGSFTFDGETLPSISTEYEGDFTFKSHEKVKIAYTVDDNPNGRFSIDFDSPSPAVTAEVSPYSVVMTIDALQMDPGSYTASIVIGRGTSHEFSYRIPFQILENHAPKNIALVENIVITAGKGENIDLLAYIKDEDGETLRYEVSSADEKTVSASASGNSLSLKGSGYGESIVTVVAKDARGAECKQMFRVLSRDTSRVVDIYPVPVHDFLNIRPGEDASMEFSLYSVSGAKVKSLKQESGPFSPVRIEVLDLAAGVYTAVVKCGEKEYRQTVTKY